MSRALSQQLERIIFAQCEDADTPRALTVFLMVKYQEYGQLFSLKTDPQQYHDSESYYIDNQVTEFLRKFGDLDVPGIDRADMALQSFWDCERLCAKTNIRLKQLRINDTPLELVDVRLDPFIRACRQILRDILGEIPKDLDLRFGPGATFEDKGHYVTVPDKMTSRPTVTSEAQCLTLLWDRTAWARARACDYSTPYYPKIVRGNRFTTVPKDALKDRGICIEPSFNVAYQLAVGTHIRRRLKLAGIDLDNGQPLHRDLAKRASLDGSLATIDLSNASDTVSLEIVRLLLPKSWCVLLETLRSSHTLVKGKWVRLEKFSSMGNGFTFELETLLFSAICEACSRISDNHAKLSHGIWVYGDDIIVPVSLADLVLTCLSWCGFTANPRKTFITGRFRESCGGDFFDGQPVRAYYQKEDPNEPHKIIAMANGVRGVARQEHLFDLRFARARRAWLRCLDMLPHHIRRLRGPVSAGDLVIHDSRSWVVREQPLGSGIWQARCWKPVQRPLGWDHWKPMVILASALYGQRSEGPISRADITGYRLGWVGFLEAQPDVMIKTT